MRIIPRIARRLRVAARVVLGLMMLVVLAAMAIATVPNVLGYRTLAVTGGSMGDSLPLGSVAITEHTPADEIAVGDIIVARRDDGENGEPIAHRVAEIGQENGRTVFWTKGDANSSGDPTGVLLGPSGEALVVKGHVPYVGYIVHFVQAPIGWALFVLLPAGLVSLAALRGIWKQPLHRGRPRPGGTGWLRWVS